MLLLDIVVAAGCLRGDGVMRDAALAPGQQMMLRVRFPALVVAI